MVNTSRRAALAAAALALAGCASEKTSPTPATRTTPGRERTPKASATSASPSVKASTSAPFALTANVKDGATEVPVDTLLQVRATGGTVREVSVTSTASGKNATQITGSISDDKQSWQAHTRLDPGASYTLSISGSDAAGASQQQTISFTTHTLTRQQEVFPSLAPILGGPFGVAMPIVVTFDLPVKDRAAFEKELKVTSEPAQEGAWGWFDDRTVMFRPKQYWKPGTAITLNANLNGANAGNGTYGQLNREQTFTIGRAQSGRVDMAKHTVTWTGPQGTKTWPMSAGKPGFITRSGTKVVMEKAENITMASETTGISADDPEGYNVKVAHALRVTNSGEFIHSAPWNEANFGRRNASHGCVGMSSDGMYALYQMAQIGDPVVFVGSNRPLEDGNGWSCWNVSWEKWKAKSAL